MHRSTGVLIRISFEELNHDKELYREHVTC